MDRNTIMADAPPAPGKGRDRFSAMRARAALRPMLGLSLMLLAAACGRAPTEDMLRGGVPARTNLHQSTTLPAEAVRTVNRNDAGWRLIYHPSRAPAAAEQQAARALCGLEHRRVARIVRLPMDAPGDDPGAAKIDVICA